MVGDFNLPDIMWMDGHGSSKLYPAYGIEINSFPLYTLNIHGLDSYLMRQQGTITFWILLCLHILIFYVILL